MNEETLYRAVETALRAPSGHNLQPWKFRIGDDHIDLFADRTQTLPILDPDNRELFLSCGGILFFLRIALRHAGRDVSVETLPDPAAPDFLARVHIGPPISPTEADARLFHAISRRRTNRMAFLERPLGATLPERLAAAVEAEGAHLNRIDGEDRRNALIELVAAGARALADDPAFRQEMAGWHHSARDEETVDEGVTNFPIEVGTHLTYAGAVPSAVDPGRLFAAQERRLAAGAPLLAVVETTADSLADWLAAGQGMAHALLEAASADVQAAFLNSSLQVAPLRDAVQRAIGAGEAGRPPQLLLAFGYAPYTPPTPRRPLSEVLL